ncbi:hypothetical protein [Mangrovibacterium marinum]|uniref:hypothetical protein n=1 Tax=Mangrovibacterium marinum TaxID=1639118 RepID=UPI002A188405|nr:hypothetical protein [Mangrovibacterium marinum]
MNELLSYNSPVEITSVPVSSENPGTANFEAFNIVEDAEADLAVESWMTNSNYFNASSLYTTVDREASLEIENWMVDSDFYTSPYASEEEQELALEAWMCDSQFFNN